MKKISTYLFAVAVLFSFNQVSVAQASTASSSSSTVHNAAIVEAKVREVFADTPAMIEIARCESKFRQFTDSGNPLRGGAGGQMVGVFQFFESVHASAAKNLGFDLTTLEGNLAYAKHVHDTQGTSPWNSARSCWDVPSTTSTVATISSPLSVTELKAKIALLQQLIALLQQLQKAQLANR
jgi:hypothetical protein